MAIFQTLRQQFGVIFVILACGFAFWRGGRPERTCAGTMLAAWLVSPLLVNTADWADPQWVVVAVDLALFGLLLWFAMRSNRFWPIWAAAFTGLDVIVRISVLIDPRIAAQAYMTAAGLWGYLVVLALVLGTAIEVRRPRRAGTGSKPAEPEA